MLHQNVGYKCTITHWRFIFQLKRLIFFSIRTAWCNLQRKPKHIWPKLSSSSVNFELHLNDSQYFLIALWAWMQYLPLGGSNTFFLCYFAPLQRSTEQTQYCSNHCKQCDHQGPWRRRSQLNDICQSYFEPVHLWWDQHYTWRHIIHQAEWN